MVLQHHSERAHYEMHDASALGYKGRRGSGLSRWCSAREPLYDDRERDAPALAPTNSTAEVHRPVSVCLSPPTRTSTMRFIVFSVCLLATWGAVAQTVVDGDTIKLNGTTYRLSGIDAAETQQTCVSGWPAGREATAYLTKLMHGRTITCTPVTTDRYGRTVAVCKAGGRDLGADMVSAGLAWAFIRYSTDYVAQEASARSARLGVHAHDCLVPWDRRAQRRALSR